MGEYLRAFRTLSGTRQFGMGPNPITLTEILAYLKIWGSDDTETFIKYILLMDEAYLNAKARKAERERAQREAQAKAKAGSKGKS